jgi:hypothetical protein
MMMMVNRLTVMVKKSPVGYIKKIVISSIDCDEVSFEDKGVSYM